MVLGSPSPLSHQRCLARLHCLHVSRRLHPQQLHQESLDGGATVQLRPQPLQLQLCRAAATCSVLHPGARNDLSPFSPPHLPPVSLLPTAGLHREADTLPVALALLLSSSSLPPSSPLSRGGPHLSASVTPRISPSDTTWRAGATL